MTRAFLDVIIIWRSRLLPHVPGHSARWGNFRGWFMFSELHIDMSFCLCRDLAFVPASGKKGKGQKWFEDSVRASPSGVPHPSSTPQPAGVPLDRTGTSAEWGSPPVSFGASPDSIGGRALSGDDDSAALPPSGVVALSEPDLEMTAMLSRPPPPQKSKIFHRVPILRGWMSGFSVEIVLVLIAPLWCHSPGSVWGAYKIVEGTFHCPKQILELLPPHHPRWWSSFGVHRHPFSGAVCGHATASKQPLPLCGVIRVSPHGPVCNRQV